MRRGKPDRFDSGRLLSRGRRPGDGQVTGQFVHCCVEPLINRGWVSADLESLDPAWAAGCRWVQVGSAVPRNEEWQLRVVHQIQHADLPPGELLAIGANAMPGTGSTAKARLHGRHVRHAEHPAEPAAALGGPLLDGAPEGCLLCSGMVQSGDDLDVAPTGQGEDEVPGPERWVSPAIDERRPEVRADPLHHVRDLGGGAGVGDVVEPHGVILPNAHERDIGAPGLGLWHLVPMPENTVDQPAQPGTPSPASAGPATGGLNKRRSIILGLVGLAFIVLIFWKVIPQIGSYSQAWDSLTSMAPLSITLVALMVIGYLAIYGLPFMAGAPGLGYWPAQQVNQAAFAISNGVPGGGAVGLAVQFGMLSTHGIAPASATAAITAVGLWSTFVTLGLPILGVGALVVAGRGGGSYAGVAVIGLAILVVAVVAFVLIMRSPRLAAAIGRGLTKAAHGLGRWIKPLRTIDLLTPIERFREQMYALLRERWWQLTAAQLGVFLSQCLILFLVLRGEEGWSAAGTSFLVVFAAFAISQIGLMIPVTPGGLGTVDAIMISLLTAFGVTKGDATGADLVWRACSYVPQIIIGVVALLTWYRAAGRSLARTRA